MSGDSVPPRLPLTAFLLRAGVLPTDSLTATFIPVATFHQWMGGSLKVLDGGDGALLAAAQPGNVVVALLSRMAGPVRWQTFIEDVFGLQGFAAGVGQSLGAIVYCGVGDPLQPEGETRWIGWTFGSGSRAIRRGAVDPRFGLVTALNRITGAGTEEPTTGTGRLRQLQYRQFGAYTQRTGHRAARDTPLDGFRMDRLTDLLFAVGGRTAGETPGQIFGGRPLRSRNDVGGVDDLLRLAQAAIGDYRDRAYEQGFSFIDDYVSVEDDLVITRLRSQLFADIVAGHDNVDAFIPDDLVDFDDERAIQFILFPGERSRSASRTTLTVDGLRAKLEGADVDALDWALRFCDTGRDIVADASVLECLAADLRLDQTRYLVSEGDFFQVDDDFVRRLDSELDGLTHTALELPCYQGGPEGRWNGQVAQAGKDQFISLDGDLVRVDGETPFEPADLVHVSGALIHAKRKGRSSALSYLFVQARRSCQLLSQIPDACEQVREKVVAAALDASTSEQVVDALRTLDARPAALEVVIAILGDWQGRSLRNLPLLAKVELVETMRQIAQLGFTPTVALVSICGR